MKELDIETLSKESFSTSKELKEKINKLGGTTTDLRFIISLRNIFLKMNNAHLDTDMFLWDLMRDHENVRANGISLFLTACHYGSVYWVDKLIDTADINDTDVAGNKAPYHAIISGNLYITKKLKEKGFDFDSKLSDGNSLVAFAAASDNLEILKWLLSISSEKDLTKALLNLVLQHDNYELTSLLLSQGVDYKKCEARTTGKTLDLVSVAIYRKRFKSLQAIIDFDSNVSLPISINTPREVIDAARVGQEELTIEDKIESRFAEFTIQSKFEVDKGSIDDFINCAKTPEEMKFIFKSVNVQPILDFDIAKYSDDIQEMIYAGMFN